MMGLLLPQIAHAKPDNYVAVSRGRALATAGDCVACHTAPGGVPYAGGLGIATPFGVIYSANLTPDNATGIGRWSEDDFARAMHEGIRPDGGHLYPAFPYTYYTKVSRDDVGAIYAFFRSLPAVANQVDRSSLPFPLDIRAAMRGWNALYFEPGYFTPYPQQSVEFNRGAYLVEGLGHCGACHTPMNVFGANTASEFLQANQLNNWTAPNITNHDRQGLGTWSVDDIVQYLATGQNKTSIASGPMAEVVMDSTSLMPQSDLHAIAVYLKERGAAGLEPPAAIAATEPRMQTGEAIYVDTCGACHGRSGMGVQGLFPRLANNPAVQQDDPTTLIHVILTGTRGAATDAAPTGPAMPALGWRLSDGQLASVVSYIRNSWGNAAPAISAGDVARLRLKLNAGRD